MSENIEALRSGYEAFNNGDADGLQRVFADDIRWEGVNSTELPGGGTFEGKQEVLQMLGEIADTWERFSARPDEFFEDGDTVVVLGHNEGTTKQGEDVKVPFAHVWRMRDAQIQRGQILTDTKVVADALGVS